MKPKLNLRLAADKQSWPQYSLQHVQSGTEAQMELLFVMHLKDFDILHSVHSNLIHIFYYKTNKCTFDVRLTVHRNSVWIRKTN